MQLVEARLHSSNNDVAVLRLKNPVTGITPVRLPLSTDSWYEQPGKVQTVVGWGHDVRGYCPPGPNARGDIPELMIAAGEKGKDTCQGDSGGPMFASYIRLGKPPPGTTPPPNPPYQYGITAFGKGCGVDPGTYTEVNAPSIREFISTSMNK